MMLPHKITQIEVLVRRLKDMGQTVATAESCTGGLLGKSITDIPGSSAVYPGGIISYCSRVKQALLGVGEAHNVQEAAIEGEIALLNGG